MIPTTVSLFCGAGGESLGKHLAFEELGLDTRDMLAHAVNHWDLAVAAHGRNLPWIHVHREDITQVTAADFNLDRINLLWASPSCTHHSRARGGKPKDDQQRSHAWEVVDRWLRVAKVDVLLIENVPEFQEWGPLDANGTVIPERKGEFFRAFVDDLRGLGYQVEWRVLCAADYGDPTTRRRFFLQAARDGRGIHWPDPTHRDSRKPAGLFDADLPPWRTAAECIDWSLPVPSIFDRKKPLADATLRRIAAGVMRYVVQGKPYIVNFRGTAPNQMQGSASGIDEPLRTVSAGGIHHGLVAPILSSYYGHKSEAGDHRGCAMDSPVPTIPTNNRHALVSAFLAKHFTGVVGSSLEAPMPTVTGVDHNALVAASMMSIDQQSTGASACRGMDEPLSTATTKARHALVAAFIQHYYGTGGQHQDPGQPLHTITTLARHGLVTVQIDGETYIITDIGMRMLEPHELASAMGFPSWYRWLKPDGTHLTKRDQVKMIGNAVPTGLAKALVKAVVLARPEAFGLVEDVA